MSAVKHTKFICTGDFPGETITARTLYAAVAFHCDKSTNVAPAVNPF